MNLLWKFSQNVQVGHQVMYEPVDILFLNFSEFVRSCLNLLSELLDIPQHCQVMYEPAIELLFQYSQVMSELVLKNLSL